MIRHSHQQLILCCRLSRGGGISSSASSCRQAAASASCASQHYHLTAPHHDFRQHRYMQSDTTTAATISNRLDFKSTPIIPSILSHIERIGVGIRPKPSRKKRRTPSSKGGGHGDKSAHTLDEVEEREYFKQGRMTSRHTNSNSQRGNVKKTDAKHGNKWQNKNNKHRDGKKQDKPDDSTSSSSTNVGTHWLPPPPFSTYTKGTSSSSMSSRQRRPVKILGSAASLNDELPRESKGLSEVALAGRSNGGKSTFIKCTTLR